MIYYVGFAELSNNNFKGNFSSINSSTLLFIVLLTLKQFPNNCFHVKHVKNVLKSQSWQKLCRSLLNVKIEFIENQPTVPKSENHNS